MGSVLADGGARADRGGASGDLIRESARLLAGTAAVGLAVGGIVGGVIGRVVMRLLVLTSDDRVDGAITDDDAVVNQFTLSGTVGLALFLAIGGVALAWLYLGARRSLPSRLPLRAAIWAVLVWAVVGSAVFDPDGFDFSQLAPRWLAVVLFSAIFLAVGALIAIYAERAIDRWTTRPVGLLPLVGPLPAFPLYVGGLVAVAGDALSARWPAVRWFGVAVMVAIGVGFGLPTAADVIRILT